jgi:twinkle protein
MNDHPRTFADFGIVVPEGRTGEVSAICPQCAASRKPEHRHLRPLSVNMDKKAWKCNHCGWTGGLISKTDESTLKYRFMVDTSRHAIVAEDSKEAEWFAKRGITYPTVLKNQIRATKTTVYEKQTGLFKEKNTIVFEFCRHGLLVNRKYRDGRKNFKLEKDCDLILWGLDHALEVGASSSLIITEGEIDKMSYNEAGLWNVVSVPNGATITPAEKEYFDIHHELPESVKALNLDYLDKEIDLLLANYADFIISTDNDAAGYKLKRELIRRFGTDRCRIVDWKLFPGCKDANDILQNLGKTEVLRSFETAAYITPDWIVTARETWSDLADEFDHGKEKGLSTGYPNVDPHFKWRLGDTIGFNGYPSHGKTVLAFNMIAVSCLLHGWKWGIYSPENMPAKRIIDSFAQIIVGNTSDIAEAQRMTKSEFYNVVNDFLNTHIYIIKGRFTPKELREKQRHMVTIYGIHGFLKDPWNSLRHTIKAGQTLDTYLEDELSEEVAFALENSVVNVINVHPPTPKDGSERSVPSPFQITGGKIWYAKLQAIICTHRPTKYSNGTEADIHVQKIKEQDLVGVPTAADKPIKMHFNRRTKRFLIDGVSLTGADIRLSPITKLYENYLKLKNQEFTF